jgi:hypothetical protein
MVPAPERVRGIHWKHLIRNIHTPEASLSGLHTGMLLPHYPMHTIDKWCLGEELINILKADFDIVKKQRSENKNNLVWCPP